MTSPLLSGPNRIVQGFKDGVRLLADSKVRGTRHRDVRDLSKADIGTVVCGLFMLAGVDAFRCLVAAVALIIGRCIPSVFRIGAGLVDASNFGCTLRRDSVSRPFRCPVVDCNVFSCYQIKRRHRLRPILQVANGIASGHSFVLFRDSPRRDAMLTFNYLVGRLRSRVYFDVQYFNGRRRPKDVFVGPVGGPSIEIVDVVVERVFRIPNRYVRRDTIVISISQVCCRPYELVRGRCVLVFVCSVGEGVFEGGFVFVAQAVRCRDGSVRQLRLVTALRQLTIDRGRSIFNDLLGTIAQDISGAFR